MPYIKVGTENGADIEVHYNDHGAGQPIVLIPGYLLDGNSWGAPGAGAAGTGVSLHQL
jgi:peroxiredoxin